MEKNIKIILAIVLIIVILFLIIIIGLFALVFLQQEEDSVDESRFYGTWKTEFSLTMIGFSDDEDYPGMVNSTIYFTFFSNGSLKWFEIPKDWAYDVGISNRTIWKTWNLKEKKLVTKSYYDNTTYVKEETIYNYDFEDDYKTLKLFSISQAPYYFKYVFHKQ